MSHLAYKYRAWNNFTKRIITHQELYFANPMTFNDIFDCQACGTIGNLNPEKYSWEDKKERRIRYALTDSINLLNKDMSHKIYRFGVCCFSKKCDSILMWSHYADYHKGLCFVFDLDKVPLNGLFADIIYANTKPRYDYCDEDEDPLKWFIYKHKDWKYEKEVRGILIPPKNAKTERYRKVHFPKKALKEIIFGAKYPDRNEPFGQVIGLCQDYGFNIKYSIMQETIISDAYKLMKVPLTVSQN